MLRIFPDEIYEPPVDPKAIDPAVLWTIVGVVAGVAALTAVLIAVLIKKKKRKDDVGC